MGVNRLPPSHNYNRLPRRLRSPLLLLLILTLSSTTILPSHPTLLLPPFHSTHLENQQTVGNNDAHPRLLQYTRRQFPFQLLQDDKFPICLALILFLLTSVNALVQFQPALPLSSIFPFVTTWMRRLMPQPLRHLPAIMTTAFKLPPSTLAHLVLFNSMLWAFIPLPLLSQIRGETGSIVGLRAKASSTCLPMRTCHLGLVELFSQMVKLYSASWMLSIPVRRCQLSRPLSEPFPHTKGIPLPHQTARCRRRSSRSVRLLRRPLVTLRVPCFKIRLVQTSCRIHFSSEEVFLLSLTN